MGLTEDTGKLASVPLFVAGLLGGLSEPAYSATFDGSVEWPNSISSVICEKAEKMMYSHGNRSVERVGFIHST